MTENTQSSKRLTIDGIQFGLAMFFLVFITRIAPTYIAYFLTDIIGMQAVSVGTILAGTGIVDTISMFIIGGVVNNMNLKGGKYRPWMFVAPPVIFVTYILMFTNWIKIGMPEATVIILLIIIYSVAQFAVNTCNLTVTGLIAAVGETFDGRVKLNATAMRISIFGGFAASAAFLPFVAAAGGGDDAKGYLLWFVFVGALILLAYLNLARVAKPYDKQATSEALKNSQKLGPLDMWKVIKGNDQFLVWLLANLVLSIGVMISYTARAYFYRYVIGDINGMTLFMTINTFVPILGAWAGPVVLKLVKAKKTLYLISMFGYAAAFGIVYLLCLFTGGISNWTFIIIINIGVFLFNMQGVVGNTFYMDQAEYGYHKTGKDSLAFMMAFVQLPMKLSQAIAGAILGYGLAAIGYTAGAAVTDSLYNGLVIITALIPTICFALAAVIIVFLYKLTDARVKEIMEENTVKREALKTES